MTNFERQIDLVSCHTALDQAREELAAAKVSLADTATSLLNSVRATVAGQQQRDKAQAALRRVRAVLDEVEISTTRFVLIADLRDALEEPS